MLHAPICTMEHGMSYVLPKAKRKGTEYEIAEHTPQAQLTQHKVA